MQMRTAPSVLPEPVGAEINVGFPARIPGQPCSCGSVGVPKRCTNHSCTTGCAHARLSGTDTDCIGLFYRYFRLFFALKIKTYSHHRRRSDSPLLRHGCRPSAHALFRQRRLPASAVWTSADGSL